jgi:hypothetical protein
LCQLFGLSGGTTGLNRGFSLGNRVAAGFDLSPSDQEGYLKSFSGSLRISQIIGLLMSKEIAE